MHHSSQERIMAWAGKIGLFALLALPLYVSTTMLFPFITGKNFMFRIIVELVAVLWVTLMLMDAQWRPRLTRLVKISTIFIVIVFLADLFSPNPYRSFFSNYERMEGFMMIFHVWLYFMMLGSFLKTRKDWLIFFHATLLVSVVVAGIALLQKFGLRVSLQGGFRVDSTIGNPAYLAAYLLFHIWMGLMLLGAFWRRRWMRILYGAVIAFEIVIVYFTATRGAVIALILGAILILGVSVFDWRRVFPERKKYPRGAAILLAVIVLIPIVFWQIRHTSFVKISPVLPRFASISLSDRTTQSRFSIWQMSFRGALERPILGWGQENYYLVFQKYFDPKLYAQEPWFDRSHNLILDWLVHTGFAGLLAYLSLIGAAVWGVIEAYRRNAIARWEGLVLVTVFFTYILQNLLVFDNLNTYLLLFGFLAYTDYVVTPANPAPQPHKRALGSGAAYAAGTGLLIAVMALGYVIHVKPMRESKALIRALLAQQRGAPLGEIQKAFASALQHRSFGDTEVREQIANFGRNVPGHQSFSDAEKKQFVEFVVSEFRKEVEVDAPDIKHMIFMASVLDRAAPLNPAYLAEAEAIMKRAVALSPTKQILYFELAQIYLQQSRADEAIDALRTAVRLEPSYQQAAVDFMIVGGIVKRADVVREAAGYVKPETLDEDVLFRVGTAYQQVLDFAGAETTFKMLVEKNPARPQYRATWAALLAALGRYDEARIQVRETVKIDPNFRQEAEEFLRNLP